LLDSVINNKDFTQMMQRHMQELIIHFLEKAQNFGILCKIEDALFEPSLPEEIVSEFRPLTLFFLAGYTFETAHIQDNNLVFEAGFGSENFGSLVRVPFVSIMQIIVDETPVMINLATYQPEDKPTEVSDVKGVKNSMASFLSNPENSKFVKDKK
jgi:hypothetical protein